MADEIKITVDDQKVLAHFSAAGIPVEVRNQLRQTIPVLLREFTGRVDSNLAVLKSRTHLQFIGGPQGQMIENAQGIQGKAQMGWTGDPKAAMVPLVIEKGARPHPIKAVNAKVLAFFWEKIGKQVFFKAVNHPGYPGIHYMERAFDSMRERIVDQISAAVRKGLQ